MKAKLEIPSSRPRRAAYFAEFENSSPGQCDWARLGFKAALARKSAFGGFLLREGQTLAV